ncbi:MAG: hypothetical protein H6667_12400 [Ardenticatenaceae bacterium]|nr:hypothetical protein [Ardenticatenaceae bacterium]
MSELIGNARRVTAMVIFLFVAIYISGFIIVNNYLWQFRITHLEFFQPPLVAAGLLFVVIVIVAGLISLPIVFYAVFLIDKPEEKSKYFENGWLVKKDAGQSAEEDAGQSAEEDAGQSAEENAGQSAEENAGQSVEENAGQSVEENAGQSVEQELRQVKGIPRKAIVYGVVLASVLLLLLFEAFGAWMVNKLLGFSIGQDNLGPQNYLVLYIMMLLQGIALSLMVVLSLVWKKLKRANIVLIFTVASLFLTYVQIYTLFLFSSYLYTELPISVGGGKPNKVILLIQADNQTLDMLDAIGLPIEEQFVEEENSLASTRIKLIKSRSLELIWQVSNDQVNSSKDSLSTYILQYCQDDHQPCSIVEVRRSIVHGIIHIKD